jgi:hypothetical protein
MLDKGDFQRSMELHKRCVRQYTKALGPRHHRTADGCVRLASHYIRHFEAWESHRCHDWELNMITDVSKGTSRTCH